MIQLLPAEQMQRCQVCGRKPGKRADGTMRRHHYRGAECFGSGKQSYWEACDAMQEACLYWKQQELACERREKAHREARKNERLPLEFWQLWSFAAKERGRLTRRFSRWLRRFDRLQGEAA
jgi:hypothetical protein